jgi:hypothetical protein
VVFHKSTGHYSAYLICAIDGNQKPLRKALADCPIKATVIIVDGLQKDSAILFSMSPLSYIFLETNTNRR